MERKKGKENFSRNITLGSLVSSKFSMFLAYFFERESER